MTLSLKYITLIAFIAVFALSFLQCVNQSTGRASVDSEKRDTTTLDGIDSETGLRLDKNMYMIKGQCTSCHSAKIITISRFTRQGWVEKIRWMQQTQNLWDLGETEAIVLDYLEKYYSPDPRSQSLRRKNLGNINWYSLEIKN